jgi:hypothetical protein
MGASLLPHVHYHNDENRDDDEGRGRFQVRGERLGIDHWIVGGKIESTVGQLRYKKL